MTQTLQIKTSQNEGCAFVYFVIQIHIFLFTKHVSM